MKEIEGVVAVAATASGDYRIQLTYRPGGVRRLMGAAWLVNGGLPSATAGAAVRRLANAMGGEFRDQVDGEADFDAQMTALAGRSGAQGVNLQAQGDAWWCVVRGRDNTFRSSSETVMGAVRATREAVQSVSRPEEVQVRTRGVRSYIGGVSPRPGQGRDEGSPSRESENAVDDLVAQRRRELVQAVGALVAPHLHRAREDRGGL